RTASDMFRPRTSPRTRTSAIGTPARPGLLLTKTGPASGAEAGPGPRNGSPAALVNRGSTRGVALVGSTAAARGQASGTKTVTRQATSSSNAVPGRPER